MENTAFGKTATCLGKHGILIWGARLEVNPSGSTSVRQGARADFAAQVWDTDVAQTPGIAVGWDGHQIPSLISYQKLTAEILQRAQQNCWIKILRFSLDRASRLQCHCSRESSCGSGEAHLWQNHMISVTVKCIYLIPTIFPCGN